MATMTLVQSAGGRPSISSRTISTSGCPASAAVIAAEKPSRSTASAPPAGTWLASAARITSELSRRISSCRSPTALCSRSSERNEFEQTSSASASVLCTGVARTGRISCNTTGTPRDAICQAASEPASPPPMTCTVWVRSSVIARNIVDRCVGGRDVPLTFCNRRGPLTLRRDALQPSWVACAYWTPCRSSPRSRASSP